MFTRKSKKKTHVPPQKKFTCQSSYQLNMDPERYQKEYGLNYNKPILKCGGKLCEFIDGKWVEENPDHKKLTPKISIGTQTSREIQKQIEENNALKIKIKVLLLLVSELKLKSENSKAGSDKEHGSDE
ncbi:hypothetical protein JTE90_007535 [Oedothorax gibbosus]|uniref:Uncharacterized protein n=1 Tax=Oedothorax gibbosus TaxID=931172 RepID=A0AAV6VMZ8_9ARAC|nr:hypothetical protein JTE90_007535 [Oedothorax gibbosus]